MSMIRALLIASTLTVASFSTGCASLAGLLGGTGEPTVGGEEMSILYSNGLHKSLPEGIKQLKISPTERVWVVNKNGGTNSDRPVDALTYDALVDVLRSQKQPLSEVAERDDDMIRSLYVEYTESDKLAARANSLAQSGKIQPADVILAYRIDRVNAKSPGSFMLGLRYVIGGVVGLFADAQPNNTDGLRIAIHLDAIDTKTGTVRATTLVEHVEPQTGWFAQDKVFTEQQ